jgi:hypothetical protein
MLSFFLGASTRAVNVATTEFTLRCHNVNLQNVRPDIVHCKMNAPAG